MGRLQDIGWTIVDLQQYGIYTAIMTGVPRMGRLYDIGVVHNRANV